MIIKKKLPIGIEFFKDFKRDDFYYVDKTGFIRDLINLRGSVNLFTRPRRFGKSLNMNMLKTFFEIGADPVLFDGLEISKETTICEQYLGKYPVISISLKDVEGLEFQTAYDMLGSAISEEARRFDYLLESHRLTQSDKKRLNRLIDEEFEKQAFLHNSLRILTELLFKHYGIPVIVLIDEYDVPLDKAHQDGYYPEMVRLIRSLFSQVFKTNPNIYFAVITGCLRIAKESIFTGLNNFKVRTISDIDFAEYFGFTDNEVRDMLSYYGLEDSFNEIKEWYNGYHFGDKDVYCPWDVVNQCDKLRAWKEAPMEAHWENSSSNAIVQEILENATETTKSQIEALISGEAVEKVLIPELTYTLSGKVYCVTVIGTLVDLTYEFVIDSQLLFFHSVDHNWIVYFYLFYQRIQYRCCQFLHACTLCKALCKLLRIGDCNRLRFVLPFQFRQLFLICVLFLLIMR